MNSASYRKPLVSWSLGRPKDLAGAVVYLASQDAGFVGSELFVVDGAIAVHA